ncbi:dynein regulatory complex subunit 3-like [Symsagittifera roscoffensis]|uniref:dynein regulatory complex subunit 3-like n=1 Tax=Symsagittifera roscoffensis TaxID=84072 RepID=UPI00307B6C7C
MSRVYDTIEPAVIDDVMLMMAIKEQGPKNQAGKIADQEGIDYKDVINLRLDFRNILQIENLWSFSSLTRLSLDNNIIERIDGLDSLVHLVWLDLSFNNIEKIDGLSSLKKLQDLTLCSNRISKIEKLDSLEQLQVLSLGCNFLSNLNDLVYLRQFKHLQSVNLSQNPFCQKEDEYKAFTIAYLPNLVYLDFRMIDPESRAAAKEKYFMDLGQLEEEEVISQRKKSEEKKNVEALEQHTLAYVENLDGNPLYLEMYDEDSDGKKLNKLPNMEEDILPVFEEKFSDVCMKIFEYGMEAAEIRKSEVDTFFTCIEEAKAANRAKSADAVEQFTNYKLDVFAMITTTKEQSHVDSLVSKFNEEIQALWDNLMTLELQLVDQLEDTIKEFERNLADLVSGFLEKIQARFVQLRELENTHSEKLLEISINMLEKILKSEVDADQITDDLRELFVDKDSVTNAVSASHDRHLYVIDAREDRIVSRINSWMTGLIDQVHAKEEIERNRNRVVEINHLCDNLRDEMEDLDIVAV